MEATRVHSSTAFGRNAISVLRYESKPFRYKAMISGKDPKMIEGTPVRCSECDREMSHYNVFLAANDEKKAVCWQCLSRKEKGFNARRDFRREARSGYIPR
jgi:hypothetical protein